MEVIIIKGSVTIEAAFIYPLIIFYIALLTLFLFYSHDKLTAKSDAYTTLISNYFNNDAPFDEKILSETLKNHCLLKSNYKVKYNNSSSSIDIEDNYGNVFSVSFSSYDKCDFIRQAHILFTNTLNKDTD